MRPDRPKQFADATGDAPHSLIGKLQLLPARHPWLRWAVLAFGVAFATGNAAYLYYVDVVEEARSHFAHTALGVSNDLGSRMRAYEDVLYAMRGLFDGFEGVTREDFHEFAEALALAKRYPGVTNISFSVHLPKEELRAFEHAVRAEKGKLTQGLPEFTIRPPGERSEYLVLHYVEPLGPNAAGWGLDLYADPMRRAAMVRARDSGEIAATSGVTLIRDAKSPTTSLLLRLAVYRSRGVPDNTEERRRQFRGVVGSTIRIEELIGATLTRKTLAGIRVVIHDEGVAPAGSELRAPETLLYDSEVTAGRVGDYSAYTVARHLTVGDHRWRLDLTPLANPVNPANQAMVALVLAASLAASLLLFWLMGSLAMAQSRGAELAQRNRTAVRLGELGEDLYSSLTPREAYEVITRDLPRLLPESAGALFVFDPSRSSVAVAAQWGEPAGIGEISTPNDCQAVRRGHLHSVPDSAHAQNCSHFTDSRPGCYVCVPMGAQGGLGVLHVQRASPSSLSDTEMHLAQVVAQHASLALANLGLREKLQEQATRDKLTGLYNRHYVQEWFDQELQRAARHQRPVGVIVIDIDHFKRVNDSFGHEAGDEVLKALGALLKRGIRGSDVACRHGGEEFLLLMPESALEGTLGKAEELRREVQRLQLEYHGRPIGPITISLGVAIFPDHATESSALLRCADAALYQAKHAGRDRVVGYKADVVALAPAA